MMPSALLREVPAFMRLQGVEVALAIGVRVLRSEKMERPQSRDDICLATICLVSGLLSGYDINSTQ